LIRIHDRRFGVFVFPTNRFTAFMSARGKNGLCARGPQLHDHPGRRAFELLGRNRRRNAIDAVRPGLAGSAEHEGRRWKIFISQFDGTGVVEVNVDQPTGRLAEEYTDV
jgi:hypothetical protein